MSLDADRDRERGNKIFIEQVEDIARLQGELEEARAEVERLKGERDKAHDDIRTLLNRTDELRSDWAIERRHRDQLAAACLKKDDKIERQKAALAAKDAEIASLVEALQSTPCACVSIYVCYKCNAQLKRTNEYYYCPEHGETDVHKPGVKKCARCVALSSPASQRALERTRATQAVVDAARLAREHVKELRDAWQRGCITERDGKGGTRSNRNADVDNALYQAFEQFDALEARKPEDGKEPVE